MPKANARKKDEDVIDAEVVEDAEELRSPSTELVQPLGGFGDVNDLFASFVDTEEYLNVLYWGQEGAGKTVALAAATKGGRVLVINAEGGLKKRSLLAHGAVLENLVIYPKPGQPLTYEGLEQVFWTVKQDLERNPKSWYAVGWDSVTDIAQTLLDSVSDERVAKARGRGVSMSTIDSFFVDRGDYGTMSKMLTRLLRRFRDLPCHFIATALERRDVDEDTGKTTYGPAVSPAVQTSLLGYVDVVLWCKKPDEDRDYYRGAVRGGKGRAKDRLSILPDVLVNPTFDRLVAYNEGILNEETDPVQETIREAAEKKAAEAAEKKARRGGRRAPAKSKETPSEAAETTGGED